MKRILFAVIALTLTTGLSAQTANASTDATAQYKIDAQGRMVTMQFKSGRTVAYHYADDKVTWPQYASVNGGAWTPLLTASDGTEGKRRRQAYNEVHDTDCTPV